MFGGRFGAKRMITFACLLAGVFGAFRGLSTGFVTLAVFTPGMPFLLWAGFSLVALVSLCFAGETGRRIET
jgi:hypothetical protein